MVYQPTFGLPRGIRRRGLFDPSSDIYKEEEYIGSDSTSCIFPFSKNILCDLDEQTLVIFTSL